MLPHLAQIMALLGKGTFRAAEGIGRVVGHTPVALGKAFSGLRGAGRVGAGKLGSAFKGIGTRIQSGIYNTAESIGSAFENPKDTGRNLMAGLQSAGGAGMNGYRRFMGAAFTPGTPRSFSNRMQHLQNAWGSAKTLGRNAASGIGGMFGGRIGRGAGALGAGMAGLASMGMKSASGLATAPFKAVTKAFSKLGAASGGVASVATLFAKLAGPTALVGAVVALKSFVNRVVESNRALGKWNGSLAASFARLDIQRMNMDIRTANSTSGTATELNDAYSELLSEFQPIREDLAILTNVVAVNLVRSTQGIIAMLKAAATANDFLRDLLEGLHILEDEAKKKKPPQNFPGNDALGALAGMGPGAPPRPIAAPRPFLNPGIAPALNPDEARRARNAMIREQM